MLSTRGAIALLSALSLEASTIAYIAPSRTNREIRVISPDGSNSRTIWTAPANTAPEDGPGTLSWRPDGRAITFDSSHEFARSMFVRDLYTVPLSGGPILRPTNMPDPSALSSMPQGSVVVRVRNAGFQGRELTVYVAGASEPVRITAAQGANPVVKFPRVADFGPNVRQYVRVLDLTAKFSYPCWFDAAAFADVKPGATVEAGVLSALNDIGCGLAFGPSWRADGRSISLFFREPTKNIYTPNNLWKVDPAPTPGKEGERLLDKAKLDVSFDQFYFVAMSPLKASPEDLLLVRNGALNTPIFRSRASDVAGQLAHIDLGRCPSTACAVTGLTWFPSGAGFYVARVEAVSSAIYAYEFLTHKLTPVLRLPNEVIGRISASPDGRAIVFERSARLNASAERVTFGPRAQCPCDLWLANRDGSGPKLLIKDARAPAWI